MLTIEKKRVSKLSVVFWSMTVAVDVYITFVLATVVAGESVFMYWLLDATYSVWFYLALGVIFIISSSHLLAAIIKKTR